MKNQFSIQYESLIFDDCHSHIIGFSKPDIKDIAISLMKLVYGKIKKITFCSSNKVTAEIIKQDHLIISIDEEKIPLTQNDVELILSFFLDATEEYMAYDHIDLEFTVENKSIDVCISIK